MEPWIEAWPRSAMIPPPGRPMLPSSSCSSAQQPIICGAVGVLGPGHRVRPGRWSGRAPSWRGSSRRPLEHVAGAARHLLDHLRRVAAEVALDDLEDAARMLQRLVALRRRLQQRPDQRRRTAVARAAAGAARRLPSRTAAWLFADCARAGRTPAPGRRAVLPRVLPGRAVVLQAVVRPFRRAPLYPSGRRRRRQVLGVLEVVVDDRGGVGVVHTYSGRTGRCSTARC